MDALTSLRFVAAILVFLRHCPVTANVAAAFSTGPAGVGFFFVLSGFILTYTYHDDFAHGIKADRVRAFYAARIARIYPVHLVTLAFALAVVLTQGGPFWSELDVRTRIIATLAQTALIQSWIGDANVRIGPNPPAWSISAEAFFYAVFPLLVFGVCRIANRLPVAALVAACVALWAGLTAAEWPQTVAADAFWLYYFPPVRCADFLIGILLGLAFVKGAGSGTPRLRPTSIEILAIGGVVVAGIVSVAVPESVRSAPWLMPWFAVLIFVFASERGACSRFLRLRVFVRCGEVSFAFYLVHYTVIEVTGRIHGLSGLAAAWIAFAVSLAAAFALFHAVEQPLRTRLRTFLAAASQQRTRAVPMPAYVRRS